MRWRLVLVLGLALVCVACDEQDSSGPSFHCFDEAKRGTPPKRVLNATTGKIEIVCPNVE